MMPAIFLGGRDDGTLPALITEGRHPRVDYREFRAAYGARLVSFDDLPTTRPVGGSYWGMALLAHQARTGTILATGEDVGLPLALAQRLTGGARPLFIIVHGSYFGSWKAAPVLRLLRDAPNVTFLCLSESLRQNLVERYRISETQALNAGYGVDTRFFQPQPGPSEPGLIVSAGAANRDYRTLAAAASGLDVAVKIAADSAWFRTDLDIARQELPPNVEARSYGDYAGLRDLYARAACVVVPLYPAVHACGYAVIAEAMAMGKPIIATRTASPSDYIIEGETGFYVPPGDSVALRERIEYLLDRPELAERMGQAARQRMETTFSLEAYNARIARAMGLSPCPQEEYDEIAALS